MNVNQKRQPIRSRSTARPASDHRHRVTKRMIDGIVSRIVENFKVEKIILFGSRAYGRPGKDSDIDLLVIMKSKLRPAQRVAQVSLLAHPRKASMDLLVYTPAEIRRRLETGDFFFSEILEKGRVLYDAAGGD